MCDVIVLGPDLAASAVTPETDVSSFSRTRTSTGRSSTLSSSSSNGFNMSMTTPSSLSSSELEGAGLEVETLKMKAAVKKLMHQQVGTPSSISRKNNKVVMIIFIYFI